nr:hypothetical protein BaRGS_003793 [Batillaria attramentaria]
MSISVEMDCGGAVREASIKQSDKKSSDQATNPSISQYQIRVCDSATTDTSASSEHQGSGGSSCCVRQGGSESVRKGSERQRRYRSVSEPDPPPPASRRSTRSGSGFGGEKSEDRGGGLSNGISSLQSLQKRFGGDFLMEPPRRPSSIIPLQSTILPSKSILRPPPIPSNGLSHLRTSAATAHPPSHLPQPHQHHHHHHHGSTTTTTTKGKPTSTKADRLDKLLSLAMSSSNNNNNGGSSSNNNNNATTTTTTPTTAATTTSKKPDKPSGSETARKTDSAKVKPGTGSSKEGSGGGCGGNGADWEGKYTIHRCSCQKSFGSLFALSAHLQETGHMPGSSKQASLMDYPKLVRGQDMWLNQESEQTRRILRCMQCGESFKSLPMLTVHMMQTQHYSKIVSADHGRRSHKCSAYCDRELDRECIFKCKVCQETFTDMEGLANHMIVSGHHKKQVLRSHNYPELGLRHKQRKRFLSDDAHSSTVASLLEYKRKFPDGGSNGYLSQLGQPSASRSSPSDSSITCESCGKKIEMQRFVEHVRACLRQKAEVIDALKNKLSTEDSASPSRHGAESTTTTSSAPKTPEASSDVGEQPLPSTKDSALFKRLELNSLRSSSPGEKDGEKPKTEKRDCDEDGSRDSDTSVKKVKREPAETGSEESADHTDDKIKTKESVSDSEDPARRPEKREHKEQNGKDQDDVISKKKIKLEDDVEADTERLTPSLAAAPSPCSSGDKKDAVSGRDVKSRDKSLDIIDPNSMDEPQGTEGGGSSALKAMESFIQRSFSSKFDSRRNSSLSSAFAGMMGTSHMPPLMSMNRVISNTSSSHSATSSTASSSSSMNYLAKFSRFFAPAQPSSSKYLDAGFDVPLPSYEKSVLSSLSARSAELLEKSKTSARDSLRTSPASLNGPSSTKPSTQTSEKGASETVTKKSSKTRDSSDEDEEAGDSGESQAGEKKEEEDLTNKYLNPDVDSDDDASKQDGEDSGKGKGKGSSSGGSGGRQSALDSLSSFVYGQPMTSEHPLDSLQKLLTRTSIPKMMSAAAGAHLHFNPMHHPYIPEQMLERMCYTPPDLPSSSSTTASAMPLNLSLKPESGGGGGAGGSGTDDDDNPDLPPDCGSPSMSHDGDDGDHSSPGGLGPDGEMVEYKCAACSRRFASKGSYRYHLSRCHLSSVKKYGIKEAFNMSPYVYLPLDHTAKFTKYYQMAQELASKGK